MQPHRSVHGRSILALGLAITLLLGNLPSAEPQLDPFLPTDRDFAYVLELSLMYYQAQISGVHPLWSRFHRANGGWRGDSHLKDGQDVGHDVSGGFYDAGDHTKVMHPMLYTFSLLAFSAYMHGDGYLATGQMPVVLQLLRHATDYVLKCHIVASDDPKKNVFVGQVGDRTCDHKYWGRPEQQPFSTDPNNEHWRPTFLINSQHPAVDVVGEAVALLTVVSLVLRGPAAGPMQDIAYADRLEKHAQQLYAFALSADTIYPMFNPADHNKKSAPMYSHRYSVPDAAWASAWRCYAAGSNPALPECKHALEYVTRGRWDNPNMCMTWDSNIPAAVLLCLYGGVAKGDAKITNAYYKLFTDGIAESYRSRTCPRPPDAHGICRSPEGRLDGVGNDVRRAASNSIVLLLYATVLEAQNFPEGSDPLAIRNFRCLAREHMSYTVGNNPRRESYVVGYTPPGGVSPQKYHHRGSSCDPDPSVPCDFNSRGYGRPGPNPNVLYGAVLAGAKHDAPYPNSREHVEISEPALDRNAAYVAAMAGLAAVTVRLGAVGCSYDQYCGGQCSLGAGIPWGASAPMQAKTEL